MPPKPLRVVRLNRTSTYGKERIRLLTYRMALSQPESTVPLLQGKQNALSAVDTLSTNHQHTTFSNLGKPEEGGNSSSNALGYTRRWVRDPDELCVASIRRSNNINRISSYVATYKFKDPHWKPFLFPEVHVLPKDRPPHSGNDTKAAVDLGGDVSALREPSLLESGPPDQRGPPSGESAFPPAPYEVFIDYNKLVNLELLSRHANFALRHLVQKGHAMYFVNYAQHSILAMRGLVESSYITCAYGIRGERLRTYLTHVGPLDVRDVIEVDPRTHRVRFNLEKRSVARGVVALSQVEGYGTWFQRKPMLWQRTRRIGALQGLMGAYDYETCPPHTVGRLRDCEVALLEPHVRALGGGAQAVGLVASSQVAQNARLFVGQFEAPAITAVDAVQQLAHRSALRHGLLRPAAGDGLRGLLAMERLLPVGWVTRTPPPYVPLEGDLPFKLQLSRPGVVRPGPGAALPTSGAVGAPFVRGAPLAFMEYVLHQGVDHYVFDDAPSARPMKWWNQKSNMPYNGHMYFLRSGLLDHVVAAESPPNPLAAACASRAETAARPPPALGRTPAEPCDPARGPDLTARAEAPQRAQARPPLAELIPLGDRAARRLDAYEKRARAVAASGAPDRPRALLRRQLRLRERRRRSDRIGRKQTEQSNPSGGSRVPDSEGRDGAHNGGDNRTRTSGS